MVPFLLLSVMLFVGARFIVFKSVIKIQKREFRQAVLKQQNKTFKQVIISAKDLYKDVNGLEWKENNNEVVIKNVYHEVLSITKRGNNYIVNVIEDKLENELFKNFFDKRDTDKDLAGQLLLVFAMNFLVPVKQEIKQQTPTELEFDLANTQTHQSDFYSKIIKPPRPGYFV